MEAAACYIGETRNPDRDAKIAMNLEGLYGLFIYTMIPVAFIIVLGLPALGNAALVDPKTIFVHFASDGVRNRHRLEHPRLADRDHADPRADPLGAERDHRHRALASPDVDRRPVPALLPAGQQARRAEPLDVVQRRLLDRGRVHGRRRRDLHVLERRLPGLVHPGADRLLPAAQAPPERAPAVQAARVDEVRGAGDRRRVRDHLLLRRAGVRDLLVQRRRAQDAALLLHRLGRAALLPAVLRVPQARRGQAAAPAEELVAPARPRRSRARPTRERDGPAAATASPKPVRRGRSSGSCSRPRGGRSPTPRSPAWSSWPSRRTPASACSRSRGSTASSFGMQKPGLLPTKSRVGRAARDRGQGGQAARAQGDRGRRPRRRHPQGDQADPPGGRVRGLRRDRDGRRPRPQPRGRRLHRGPRSPSGCAARPRRSRCSWCSKTTRTASAASMGPFRPSSVPAGRVAIPRARQRAAVQPRQLDRQLERQQVVLVEVQPGQLLDPPQPLAQRVRVDEQLARSSITLRRSARYRSSVSSSDVRRLAS